MTAHQPFCPYCGKAAELLRGADVYPHRPDLHHKRFWACLPCKAWVGCHGKGRTPLGRLATAELRQEKMRAHAAFDPIWRGGRMKRSAAYSWLASELGIPASECHIGMFDVEKCRRVVEICTESRK